MIIKPFGAWVKVPSLGSRGPSFLRLLQTGASNPVRSPKWKLKVLFSEDPAFVLSGAGVFLASQPVLHNLILSILHARVAQGDPGRYWMAIQREDIVGDVVQSSPTFPATLTPMEPPVATAMANAIAEAGVALPGVNGDAATAATFAGQWSECTKSAATPFQGNRLCELLETGEVPDVEGKLRQAGPEERSQMSELLGQVEAWS